MAESGSVIVAARTVFCLLGLFMVAVLVYTITTDGLPFRLELLTPWMADLLVDFYIGVVAIAVWVAYKESSLISTALWTVLLICLGSIISCAYVVLQLFRNTTQDRQDPVYHVLVQHSDRNDSERQWSSVLVGKITFSLLGFVMLATLLYTIVTDGSPFRKEIYTPWVVATLIDFYINITVISAWVLYKEATWLGACFWILLLICFGSITTCLYIVVQLFKLSPGEPFGAIFVASRTKQVRGAWTDL